MAQLRWRPALALATSLWLASLVPAAQAQSQYAKQIVEATVTRDIVEASFATVKPMMMPAIKGLLAPQGIRLSAKAEETLGDVLMEKMIESFIAEQGSEVAKIYDDLFTQEELKGIADFYATDLGQVLLSKQPELINRSAIVGQKIGEQVGRIALEETIEIVQEQGIDMFETPGFLDRILGR